MELQQWWAITLAWLVLGIGYAPSIHAFIVFNPLVGSVIRPNKGEALLTPMGANSEASSLSTVIDKSPYHLLVITKDIAKNLEFVNNIIPKEIASLKAYEIVDEDQCLDEEKLNELHNSNSVYLLYEGGEDHNREAVRLACKHTLYIPGLQPGGRHETEASITAACAKRLRRLTDTASSQATSSSSLPPVILQAGLWSHFLSLTCPDVQAITPILPTLRLGVDAFELRVDLLDDQSPRSIHRQVALLKDTVDLPIVYTVRTRSQIGKYPDDAVDEIQALLLEGLRAGVEWLDVEASLPTDRLLDITSTSKARYSHTTRILGSLHVTTPPQSISDIKDMYGRCDLHGSADLLKVVTGADGMADCTNVQQVGAEQVKPFIGLCLGEQGSYSRVLNRRFTPVTHELLAAAAPGQLSAQQLMDRRMQGGLVRSKKFFLFGTPIQQSLSPVMHNQAYQSLLLPHVYALNEQQDVQQYIPVISDESFGGASVTIPHKESIVPLLDELKGAAEAIGAVNTIVVHDDDDRRRRLVGYNTDYIGIKRPIQRLLRYERTLEGGIGLVVGAGGTARAACYAVKDLGLSLVVTNRSPEKGRELADRFGGTFIDMQSLEDELASKPLKVIVSTLPSSAGFTVPIAVLKNRPVVFDVVYKPAKTALIVQAMEHGCPFVQGATMLLEQGIEQFELWHRRRAPLDEMRAAVFSGVEELR